MALRAGKLAQHSDVILAVAVVGVLLVLIVPIPTALVDVLLTLNIAGALLLLMVTLSAAKSLEFSTFPSLLLFTTLLRLSLNVASTRLILLNGYAGEVINAFGNFVVGGNVIVGMIVFLILVIIQFVVITKGSGRISEVAARFTLDAMPGKQMAIDADLNSGLISEDDARARRQKVAEEAEFYGAMDGASKFVRGDAVAGIIITAVNLVGGILMGKLNGLSIGEAVQTYSILTVGDGLVSQSPSLIIATTAGIIVTKASSSSNLARDMASQVLMHPRSLATAAGMVFFFGIIPGLPTIPFFILGTVLAGVCLAVRSTIRRRDQADEATKIARSEQADPEQADGVNLPRVDRLSIEVGFQLIPLLDPMQSDDMLRKIRAVRQQLAANLGIVVPPVRIHDNLQLQSGEYAIRMRGNEIARGSILANNMLAIDSGMVTTPVQGVETTEPAFGLPALWIDPTKKDEAQAAGYTVADSRSVLITHLTEAIKKHACELLTREDVRALVDGVKAQEPTVVEELIPNVLSLGGVQKVLQGLLAEGIPITDHGGILEAIADNAGVTTHAPPLVELVRKSLSRTICTNIEARGKVCAITLDPTVEQMIAQSVQESPGDDGMVLEPARSETLVKNIVKAVRETVSSGYEAVLLTSSPIRRHVRRIVQHVIPELPVLAYDELIPEMKLEGLSTVALEECASAA